MIHSWLKYCIYIMLIKNGGFKKEIETPIGLDFRDKWGFTVFQPWNLDMENGLRISRKQKVSRRWFLRLLIKAVRNHQLSLQNQAEFEEIKNARTCHNIFVYILVIVYCCSFISCLSRMARFQAASNGATKQTLTNVTEDPVGVHITDFRTAAESEASQTS